MSAEGGYYYDDYYGGPPSSDYQYNEMTGQAGGSSSREFYSTSTIRINDGVGQNYEAAGVETDFHSIPNLATSEEERINHVHDDPNEFGSSRRHIWSILSWVVVGVTILLNLIVIFMILIKRNAKSVINKVILTLAFVDLIHGVTVSPFFVENYINLDWSQSDVYCVIYEFIFTFHDVFVALLLLLLSTYVALKFSGANETIGTKKTIYMAFSVLAVVGAIVLSIPATLQAGVFIDNPPDGGYFKAECRTLDSYTMILVFISASAMLFCFTMAFLFSLCMIGSPLLSGVYINPNVYSQRWHFLLTLAIVNILYIISGFFINFKETSRLFAECCEIKEPYLSINTLTYDIWSFLFLQMEGLLRPLAFITFYWFYLVYSVPQY